MPSSHKLDLFSVQRPALAFISRPKPSYKKEVELDITDPFQQKEVIGSSSAVISEFNLHHHQQQQQQQQRADILDNEAQQSSSSSVGDLAEIPDGGLEAYLVVFGGFCSTFVVFGFFNTIGAVQTYLTENTLKEYSISSVGWMFSTYSCCVFGGSIISGPLFDFKGARIPMVLGSVMIVVGFFTAAECTTIYQFVLSFGIALGLGSSAIFTACMGAASQWFDKKKASALGVTLVGGGLGGVVLPLILRSSLPSIGFQWSMRIFGFISILLLGCGCLLVKHRVTEENHSKDIKSILRNSFVIKDLFTDKVYASYAVSLFLAEFSYILVTTYITSYVVHNGYSQSDAFLVLITLNSVSILGRYVPNYFGDILGSFNMMCVTSIFTTLFIFILWYPFGKSLAVMYGFAAMQGFFALAVIALAPVCCARISKIEDFGRRYGTVYFLVSFGNLISLPIGGAIIGDDGKGYDNLVLLACCLQAASCFFWCVTRCLAVGFDLRQKY